MHGFMVILIFEVPVEWIPSGSFLSLLVVQ